MKGEQCTKCHPNLPTTRKHQPKEKPSSQDQASTKRKTDAIIAGDSILNHIEGPGLSNNRRHTKVHSLKLWGLHRTYCGLHQSTSL